MAAPNAGVFVTTFIALPGNTVRVFMYVAQGETDGVKIMLLSYCGYFLAYWCQFSNIDCYSTASLSRWFPLSTWHPQLHLHVSAYQFLRWAAPGNTECWKRHLAGEIGSAGVRLVSSDHDLFHDRRRALILINPYISLIGPLETKPKEKQKNFQKMKRIWKCRLQSGSHFVSQQH